MHKERRIFLRKLSIAGAAVLTAPTTFAKHIHENDQPENENVPKTWLFQGDSITDGGRSYNLDWNHIYGQDYAYMIAGRVNLDYPKNDYKIFNRGISGNTVNDLAIRWQKDTIDIQPDLLSILVGINDVFAVLVKNEKLTVDDFRQDYDTLLTDTINKLPSVKLVLCEPFILSVGMVEKNLDQWSSELKKRQAVVRQLASKYNAVFVPLQNSFNDATKKAPASHWIWDGIHPMPAGHELIAREWLKTVRKCYQIF